MSEPMDDMYMCPKGCDLKDKPIPEESKHLYHEGSTHFSRKIGIYDMVKDRTVEWLCPDCGHRWPR